MFRLLLLALALQRLEQPERVSLASLATVELPPSFKPVGRGQDGPRPGNFSPETLDRHRNPYQITFRFEQGQHTVPGGYLADPVLLHVTLFNPTSAPPDPSRISFTTITRFYPPVSSDRPRLDAHFAAQRWLPDVITGRAVTRTAATNEGRGDNLVSGPPERWLVIHVDPVRRVRVDLYAWRKLYTVDEAQALVRRAAESVEVTPKLAELFAGVNDVDAREEARFEQTVTDALAALNRCGIQSIGPEMVAWSDRCAAWLSADRRVLRVARTVGRVPLSAATRRSGEGPEFRVPLPRGRDAKLIGPPDFRMVMFYWDGGTSRWSLRGFGEHLHEDDEGDNPFLSVISTWLGDRASAHLLALASYDLKFSAERVAIDAFLAEADRVATALRAGKVIQGVTAAPDSFEH
jgi:hypothetical protein